MPCDACPPAPIAQAPTAQALTALDLAALPAATRAALLDGMEALDEPLSPLLGFWPFWARRAQRPPPGRWRTWLLMGGRGAGKTRAASEWVREMVETGAATQVALIGPTFADVRDVMVEGPSGLIAIATPGYEPAYQASRRRLVWPDGAAALMFSAEDPDSLRGPEFDLAWGDELAAWARPGATLDILRPALRAGIDPRIVLSTTPRPVPALRQLLADPTCAVTRSGTRDNAANLAAGVVDDLTRRWAGTVWARQELDGELIEDPAGALWSRDDIAAARARSGPDRLDRVLVAVDPPAGMGGEADACGIVVAGAGGEGRERRAVVLADMSVQGLSPQGWAARAAAACIAHGADFILAEANQGGEMVRAVLEVAAPDVPVRLVHARTAKRARAEPVVALYAAGRVSHAGHFRHLEDEMCRFGAPGFTASPDRLDALVWALATLLLDPVAAPRARSL